MIHWVWCTDTITLGFAELVLASRMKPHMQLSIHAVHLLDV